MKKSSLSTKVNVNGDPSGTSNRSTIGPKKLCIPMISLINMLPRTSRCSGVVEFFNGLSVRGLFDHPNQYRLDDYSGEDNLSDSACDNT